MKKMMLTLIAAATLLGVSAHAKDTTVDKTLCYIKADREFTGEVVLGRDFFRKAVAYSNRHDTCVIAKIFNERSTSRIYFDGRRYGDRTSGMTAEEVRQELFDLGLRPSACTVFSCVESQH
ncbi:MAG: hypothetical protein KF865_08750 [Bdellovibrionaceae bacterium]|nr:hypothetical protein [Pseudobdellovibrionaceae bacterium]